MNSQAKLSGHLFCQALVVIRHDQHFRADLRYIGELKPMSEGDG